MDNKVLYEKFDWSKLKQEHLKEKIKKILDNIPSDVYSIIDVGCGNGVITNILGDSYDVTAVDRSAAALEYVNTKKIQSSSDKIPLDDKSFDMVFSSELLEHLPLEILEGTISEFKRLSKKYIFITVPNDESSDKLSIKCPECSYIYNYPNHLSSFSDEKIQSLFPNFKLINTFTFGRKTRYYNKGILKLKKKITPSNSWIPNFWIEKSKRNAFCPKCEHEFYNKYKFNPIATILDIINVIISPKKPFWMFVILERK